jgi:hypothetical protein
MCNISHLVAELPIDLAVRVQISHLLGRLLPNMVFEQRERESERWLAVKCWSYNIGLGLGLVLLPNFDLTFISN